MSINNDPLFGPHLAALRLWSTRNEVLATNIANADTPNYKARDIDFQAALAGAGAGNLTLATPRTGHRSGAAGNAEDATLAYRLPTQPAQDGNTVEADVEQAAFAENALRYQVSLRFISGRISSMRAAITGAHQ